MSLSFSDFGFLIYENMMGLHELCLHSKLAETYMDTIEYLDHDGSFTGLDYILNNVTE